MQTRLEFPDGSLYELLTTAAATAGARTEFRITLPPTPAIPPPHLHPTQDETWTVEAGRLDAMLDGRWCTLDAGQTLPVPRGHVHTFRNRSGENVQFRSVHAPSGRLEQYVERLYWLSAMNRIRQTHSLSSLLYVALLWETHRDDLRAAGRARQLGITSLAAVARLLRMRVDR